MDVQAVVEEIGETLGGIDGLRVYDFPADSVTPPAAIVVLPDEVIYDETYGRGMDRMTVPVLLVAGRQSDRAAAKKIAGYMSGAGSTSVKAVINAVPAWTAMDTVRVMRSEFDVATVGGVDYFAALFDFDITGSGES